MGGSCCSRPPLLPPGAASAADAARLEVRCRPLVRTAIADLARAQPAPAGVARLATVDGLTG
ncbi:hypothetical protein AB0B85_15200 [Micromonospora sp. NPDC049044]|uniref:hypothetical protein n=1 Tax=unclassified Micromonospora TaxID=2617518 RepID=UPI0033E45061